ncbi:MAG: cytochrome c maturation protein CcmE [Gammaproteobacteria bacterium]|nr:cytochrome c maturation protein CcmE [Gammaproteobacteria bacterium]
MNTVRRKRLILISIMIAGVGAAVGFALYAFNQNMMFYYSPTQVMAGEAPAHAHIRLGGVVVKGSFKRIPDSIRSVFVVSDGGHSIKVQYDGVLPDLFREGQVVLAKGVLDKDKLFVADEVLAKHDEKYMPREVVDSLNKAAEAKVN